MGIVSNARIAWQRRRGHVTRSCSHVAAIRDVERASDGCAPCIELGDTWVHLRMCMTCGLVNCCDSSKNRHAHRHADEIGHPIARSVEPGEDWMWCYVDDLLIG